MRRLVIRPLDITEIPILKEFIYQAIFQRNGTPTLPRSIIDEPAIAVYIQDFGKPDDHCLVADVTVELQERCGREY